MRLILDSLVALMLAAVLAGVVLHNRDEETAQLNVESTREAVLAIRQQVTLQSALMEVELSDAHYPLTVDPEWFKLDVPRNHLFDAVADLPWLEVAGPRERNLLHPRVRMITSDETLATFWYNPYKGIVRARVPKDLSNDSTLRLYNEVNGTSIPDLFATISESD